MREIGAELKFGDEVYLRCTMCRKTMIVDHDPLHNSKMDAFALMHHMNCGAWDLEFVQTVTVKVME